MPGAAPRCLCRLWRCPSRGALRALCLWLAVSGGDAMAQTVTAARYAAPTDRYAHGILGDPIEWGALELTLSSGDVRRFVLPVDHVFEDVAPRLADLDGDGAPEVIVVETDVSAGGALAVYGPRGKIAETPHIGTRNRWLAPIGAADLDGDGAIEIAFIDRPHLAKTLRVWRYAAGGLREVASLQGFTNHRIGEVDIAGGVRTCNGIPEMIVASANWSRLVSVSWVDAAFAHKDIGRDTTRAAFGRAMACIP